MNIPICPHCESEEIVVDALAYWSKVTGDWEVHSTYEAFYCQACGEESKYTDFKEVPNV
jgi:predicted RNA-binding Zn-ribbon protein involved in translation (DUF1610 family)